MPSPSPTHPTWLTSVSYIYPSIYLCFLFRSRRVAVSIRQIPDSPWLFAIIIIKSLFFLNPPRRPTPPLLLRAPPASTLCHSGDGITAWLAGWRHTRIVGLYMRRRSSTEKGWWTNRYQRRRRLTTRLLWWWKTNSDTTTEPRPSISPRTYPPHRVPNEPDTPNARCLLSKNYIMTVERRWRQRPTTTSGKKTLKSVDDDVDKSPFS